MSINARHKLSTVTFWSEGILYSVNDRAVGYVVNVAEHENYLPCIFSVMVSTVPPIVNAGDWGCNVRDLETIIVLVLLAFNFIPQYSQNSLTFTRSRLRDSATVTLRLGMAQQLTKWSHRHNRSAYSPEWRKAPSCIGEQ